MAEFDWWYYLSKHWGKILGGLLGLVFALLVVNYGFWISLFIYLCIAAGLLIGWRLDMRRGLGRIFKQFFSSDDDS